MTRLLSLLKNEGRLFTFLDHDNVPWNNNNAEHALRAFTKLRNVMATSTPKGTKEYAILVGVQQTLKYRNIDFHGSLSARSKVDRSWVQNRSNLECNAFVRGAQSALSFLRASRVPPPAPRPLTAFQVAPEG